MGFPRETLPPPIVGPLMHHATSTAHSCTMQERLSMAKVRKPPVRSVLPVGRSMSCSEHGVEFLGVHMHVWGTKHQGSPPPWWLWRQQQRGHMPSFLGCTCMYGDWGAHACTGHKAHTTNQSRPRVRAAGGLQWRGARKASQLLHWGRTHQRPLLQACCRENGNNQGCC